MQDDVQGQVRAVYRAAHRTREASPTLARLFDSVGRKVGLVSGDGSLTRGELEWAAKELNLGESSRVLDIGCGAGGIARSIARRWGCHVAGTDLLWQRIKKAREKARGQGLGDRVQLIQADAGQGLGVAPGIFDTAVLIDALVHLPDQDRVCRDMARVLRPGGRIMIVTVLGTRLSEQQARVLEETTATLFRLELPDLLAMVERAGLEVCVQLDRTGQLRRLHQLRYDVLQGARDRLETEIEEHRLAQMLERARTTVDLLTNGTLTSMILIAAKPA